MMHKRSRVKLHALGTCCVLTLALLLAVLCATATASDAAAGADDAVAQPAGQSGGPAGVGSLQSLDWVVDSLLARPELRGTELGIFIESLDTGELVYAHRADAPMIPASNMKVITAAGALSLLGADYKYETVFSTNAPAIVQASVDSPRVLQGDVFIRGSGDPSIVSEELWKMAERFRTLGIERIEGDLVFDASCFSGEETTSEDVAGGDRAYHARTGALSANFNTVRVHVLPGLERGDSAIVIVSPGIGFVRVDNQATTCAASRRATIEVRRRSTPVEHPGVVGETSSVDNLIIVSGRTPVGGRGTVVYRSIDDPLGNFAASLEMFLASAGVVLSGDLRSGDAPEDARELFVHRSKPLSLIVRDVGKYSNNFVAEQLVKTLGAEHSGEPGTTSNGCEALREYVASTGVDIDSILIADGSGFSRSNRLTARAIVHVIRSATDDFATFPEFLASLSVSGTDGTLSDRMGYGGLEGSIRAKTGLLNGVTAISGIMESATGERLLFSILTNGSSCEAWKVHDMEHAILMHVHQGD
ncbi:D-alanyl-D-alanine carboxypeptidase/D-alanyl-D-alanine-endopeptidase [bacterium]|nr:D-alanyl-D-alanine carboxypeptidase/D-alanyl-D-alanine-endopeptidase [bacterium]